MAFAGFRPEDISNVVLAHCHGDHINGLHVKNGSMVYSNARVHVFALGHVFWTCEERSEAAPAGMRGAFANAKRALTGLTSDQLFQFESGNTLALGVQSVAAFGQTSGHSLFTVRSESQSFACVADITNVPSLFARNPDWAVLFDMNPEMARQSRLKNFDMLVKEKMMAGGFHFPYRPLAPSSLWATFTSCADGLSTPLWLMA